MDLTVCPECAEVAEIEWRAVLESTDGPIEHARVVCVSRHWFVLPVADLARQLTSEAMHPQPAIPGGPELS